MSRRLMETAMSAWVNERHSNPMYKTGALRDDAALRIVAQLARTGISKRAALPSRGAQPDTALDSSMATLFDGVYGAGYRGAQREDHTTSQLVGTGIGMLGGAGLGWALTDKTMLPSKKLAIILAMAGMGGLAGFGGGSYYGLHQSNPGTPFMDKYKELS